MRQQHYYPPSNENNLEQNQTQNSEASIVISADYESRGVDETPELPTPNTPPKVVLNNGVTEITIYETNGIRFNAQGSVDTDGEIVSYAWKDMDGNVLSTEPSFSRGFNVAGTYQKTLTVTDDKGVSTSASIKIIVLPAVVTETNTVPTATAQSVTMDEDMTRDITLSGADTDGDTLTYTIVTPPSQGTLNGTAPNVNYTPTTDYFGSDSFTFKVNDGTVDSAVATVDITINDIAEPIINTSPTATAQSVTLDEDSSTTITLAGTDLEGDSLTYSVVNSPSHGTFDGTTYTPTADYHGTDSFTFKANDGALDSEPATVSITVRSVNDAPTVAAQADASISEGTAFTPSATANDTDGTIVSTVWSENGTTLSFPKDDFSAGEHTLTVMVTDNEGAMASDTMVLTVTKVCKPLSKTGQTESYNTAGDIVTDGSVKDDGYYQKGADVTPRYTRDADAQVVTDHVTGLQWQDDVEAASVTKPWVTQANYNAGDYNNTAGDTAATYCVTLTLDGGGWRLPTIEELVYITDKGRSDPAIDPAFENVSSSRYWSSTTRVGHTNYAWYVNFYDGYSYFYINKRTNFYVRCVRDGE